MKLTDTEKWNLVAIAMERRAIKAETAMKLQQIDVAQAALKKEIEARLGVNLSRHTIDVATGELTHDEAD